MTATAWDGTGFPPSVTYFCSLGFKGTSAREVPPGTIGTPAKLKPAADILLAAARKVRTRNSVVKRAGRFVIRD
jgi:hypothetical protein